jgi:predicted dehydrogenase
MITLRAGLLGLGRGGQQLAATLRRSSWCQLVSVGSLQPSRLEQFAGENPGTSAYNDYRLAIVSRPLDVLFVAIPPFLRPDYLRLAAERSIPVWMLSPPLNRFDQFMEVVELFERADVPIAAARMHGVDSLLRSGSAALERLGSPFLAEGHVRTCWSGELGWRGNSTQAGGGTLIDRGYLLLDAILQFMGAADCVVAAMGRAPLGGTRTLYDTEDTAVLICRYASGAIATLSACRTAGPDEWSLRVSAVEGCLEIDAANVVVRDRAGVNELYRQPRTIDPIGQQIDEFIEALQTNRQSLTRRLREHSATMAAMQAAYLSARTGHPEAPSAISEMHRVR